MPFYSSVDLRNAGFKLAPVDLNLFPGGFNNLNPEFLPLCVHAAMSAVQKICPDSRRFMLVPENHTRNLHYLQNVAVLQAHPRRRRARGAHRQPDPGPAGPTEVETAHGREAVARADPAQRQPRRRSRASIRARCC